MLGMLKGDGREKMEEFLPVIFVFVPLEATRVAAGARHCWMALGMLWAVQSRCSAYFKSLSHMWKCSINNLNLWTVCDTRLYLICECFVFPQVMQVKWSSDATMDLLKLEGCLFSTSASEKCYSGWFKLLPTCCYNSHQYIYVRKPREAS